MNDSNVVQLFGKSQTTSQPVAYSSKVTNRPNWNMRTIQNWQIGLTPEEQMEKLGVNYNVVARPNKTVDNNGRVIDTGKKTIFNTTNNKVLGVQGMGYNIVLNEAMNASLMSEVRQSGLPLEHAFVRAKIDNYGQRTRVDIIFPHTSFEVGKGDEVAFCLSGINSFDGSGSYHIKASAYREVCANGMVSPSGIIEYRKKHTKDLSVKKASQIIVAGLEQYEADKESLLSQTQTRVELQDVYEALAIMNDINLAVAPTYEEYQRVIRPTLKREPAIERHMGLWRKYRGELGSSQWALNNVLTHIATHGDKPEYSGSVKIATRNTKEKLVVTALRGMLATS